MSGAGRLGAGSGGRCRIRKLLLTAVFAACAAAGRAEEAVPGEGDGRGELILPLFGERPEASRLREWGLGPADARDPWPLALLHFTIPVETPETVPKGRFRGAGLQAVWANSSFVGFRRGREFVIDAEIVMAQLQARYGLTDRLELGVEAPLIYAGAGELDRLVERFHLFIGSGGQRRQYLGRNDYRVFVANERGTTWFERDFGLGDLAVFGKYRVYDGSTWIPAAAASVHVKAPTASTKHLGRQGWDLTAELCLSKRIGPLLLYGGGGGWTTTDPRIEGVHFHHYAALGWAGVELGLTPHLAIEIHSTVRTSLLRETAQLDAGRYYIVGSVRYRQVIRGVGAEAWIGVLENFSKQENTADIGFIFGLDFRF